MAKSKRTSSKVIPFPMRNKRSEPPANNWVFRLVENNEDLVTALGVILESYKSVIAGESVCNADVIRQVDKVLKRAMDVKWDAIR